MTRTTPIVIALAMLALFVIAPVAFANTVILEAHFNTGANGFTYVDDPFRETTQPTYASGAWVSGVLQVTLGLKHATTPLVARPTDDLEAYQLYLRGREAAYLRSPASLRRAIEYFRQALARDPDYARAHLGLAEAHIGLGVYQYIPTVEAATDARYAARRAD